MTIKKQFVELVDFLETNKNKKVGTILEQVLSMVESKKRDNTVLKDENGNVIAIFCYYHKQWELIKDVSYGKKASSASGYNTMCKMGVSKWTKQQSTAKKSKEDILTKVQNGDIEANEIKVHLDEVEVTRTMIDTFDMPKGYLNEEDVVVTHVIDKAFEE